MHEEWNDISVGSYAETEKYKFNHRFMRIKARVSLLWHLLFGLGPSLIKKVEDSLGSLFGMNGWQKFVTNVVDWVTRHRLGLGNRKSHLDPEIHWKLRLLDAYGICS